MALLAVAVAVAAGVPWLVPRPVKLTEMGVLLRHCNCLRITILWAYPKPFYYRSITLNNVKTLY